MTLLKSFAIALCTCFTLLGYSQSGLVAHFSFDDCAVTDELGNSPDGIIGGNPDCGCGAVGNALIFDGVNDYVDFQNNYSDLLSQDFTASFYMAPENVTGVVDIFSKRKLCTPDSAVAVRYEPQSRTLRAELTEGISERAEITARLPQGQCWFHITWVRSGRQLLLYVDGLLVSTMDFDDQIDARNAGIFSIANSPCLANGEFRFAGGLDEFKVFDRALNPDEVWQNYVPIDQIITRDTVVFQGSSVQISLTNSCANSYLWTPADGVFNPDEPEPLITPFETNTYGVVMDYGFCQAIDTIQIIVVDSNELDCDDVFLPNAFTPNEDGLNDTYGMSNANFFLGDFISMQIYDRWGSKLFEGLTPDQKWDGTVDGQFAMPGIYVYKVRFSCDGKEGIATGSFNLLR